MKNEFIKYNEALALKKLGFDEPCLAFYNYQGKLIMMSQENEEEISIWKNSYVPLGMQYAAPTFYQAFKWFMDKHGNLLMNDWGKVPHFSIIQIGECFHLLKKDNREAEKDWCQIKFKILN